MSALELKFTPSFARDIKRLDKKHVDTAPLEEVLDLIAANTAEALEELRRRHRMHTLGGSWSGSSECHVCNAGDWLLIWRSADGYAYIQRTGSHDELFR